MPGSPTATVREPAHSHAMLCPCNTSATLTRSPADQDDDDGHGPWGPSRGILERGRQAFDILRRVGGSASAGGSRERTLLAKL